MRKRPTLLVSTCGTSLLTNALRGAPGEPTYERALVFDNANAASEEAIPEADRAALAELIRRARARLDDGDPAAVQRASAELNALLRIDGALAPDTLHYLIASDTYLGRATAAMVADYLAERGTQAQVIGIDGLSTASAAGFRDGIKELLRFLDETLAGFGETGASRQQSHHVVFNLTGGFKSLLGFMTAIGNFYADEVVYVFEGGRELLRIPKLPLRLDEIGLRASVGKLLLMSAGAYLPAAELTPLSPALLEEAGDDRYGLSVWGELVWRRLRDDWLAAELVDLPRLHYEDSFRKDFTRAERRVRIDLQETLADVSRRLGAAGGDTAALKGGRGGGLLYDNYTGRDSAYGHFRLTQGMRVSCEARGGTLYLRHVGAHDYVNDRP